MSILSLLKNLSGFGTMPPVCTENLNPNVMVMKAAKDRV